ncbi:type IV secretory system conjugative DNA transfer family protein [Cerasicoccus maritimus]|uniref:type IV secretory system conjugative DNA transfer family protein n=1 Tax=Cerasicoccus maritimus TaxID=490089 RepID=UPI0028529F17|nr:type IV secretion system DNA-binding domain-containing protein [Cerasicoccus maritimus]
MSIEAAMIQRSRSFLQGRQIERILESELLKGCSSEISPEPVALIPPYRHLRTLANEIICEPKPMLDPAIFRLWLSPQQEFSWVHSERFLKELTRISSPATFEIHGNSQDIQLQFRINQDDAGVLQTAFNGEHQSCQLTRPETCAFRNCLRQAKHLTFRDYYPAAPYHGSLTRHDEFVFTPFESLLCALSYLPEDVVGFYQCVFQPVSHAWHENIETIYDLEYLYHAHRDGRSLQYASQLPSTELKLMTQRLERKADPDKPFFATVIRIGMISDKPVAPNDMQSLTTFLGLLQQNAKQLTYLDQDDYAPVLPSNSQRRMLEQGVVHRNGFLCNSQELVSFVHTFDARVVTERQLPIELASDFASDLDATTEGVVVGLARNTGVDVPIRIPSELRERTVHLMGSSGSGKTSVMIHMALQDVAEGHGLVFIDPHGDAVKDILTRLPEEHLHRVIWLDAGNPNVVPAWNPLHLEDGANLHRLADDMLASIERVSTAWGDRLAHVLRNGLLGLLQAKPQATLRDLYDLIRDTPSGAALRELIVSNAADDTVCTFWKHDFMKAYKRSDLAAPAHKLDKLMSGGTIQLMYSQRESRIGIPRVMDEGSVLLVDLSTIGQEARSHLGSFLLTQFMTAALGRSQTSYERRRSFGVYLDECHLFVGPDTIESLITQARKYRVRLVLANQYLKQFGRASQIDALSTVGCAILGRLDRHDASYLAKDFSRKGVTADDLASLEPYTMFARLDTEVCKLRTLPLTEPVRRDVSGIIQDSYERYYRSAEEVRGELSGNRRSPVAGATQQTESEGDFYYEEF